MKVIQVLPDLNGGGVERGTLEVGRALVEAGHQSVVVSAGGKLVAQLEQEGSEHVTWDLGRKSLLTFRHIWAFRRWLKAQNADVLHLRSRMPAWIAWLAWRGMPEEERPHLVTTVHGLYSVSRYSEIMCRGEKVIAVSNTVRRYIEDNYPSTDPSKIEVIHRGIDPEEFPLGYKPEQAWLEQWYSDWPQTKGKLLLTLPGRLTRLKGHHDFIALIAQLKQQGMNVHGLIVGGVDPKRKAYAEELRQAVSEQKLEQDITFTGARSDIREVYAISNLVLSLSTKPESFGRTVVEALNMGVPVLGYDHGGVGEVLSALYPEGLTALGDQQALAESVTQLLESPAGISENVFLLDNMLNGTLGCYSGLSNERAAR